MTQQSDIRCIEISGLQLKSPIKWHKISPGCTIEAKMTLVTIYVRPTQVTYLISNGHEFCEALGEKRPDFDAEDIRRIDWLISSAQSLL